MLIHLVQELLSFLDLFTGLSCSNHKELISNLLNKAVNFDYSFLRFLLFLLFLLCFGYKFLDNVLKHNFKNRILKDLFGDVD